MTTLLAIMSAVAGRSKSLVAPETINNTANRTRPKVTNAGMVGLTGVLKDAGSQWRVDYGRSATGFQTMKFSSVDLPHEPHLTKLNEALAVTFHILSTPPGRYSVSRSYGITR